MTTKCVHCLVYAPNDYGCCPQCGAPLIPIICHTQRIAINTCFGGFQMSPKAIMLYAQKKGIELHALKELTLRDWFNNKEATYYEYDPLVEHADFLSNHFSTKPLNADGTVQEGTYWYIDRDSHEFRTDPIVIELIETLGSEVNTEVSDLKIVDVPDGIRWTIEEYDGVEWISENHRTWR